MEKLKTDKYGFRLRGNHMSRIDAFSDVVFGFALTLLVVSLEVPKTFNELQSALGGFFPFAICFAILITIWIKHYDFFRRYGLEDSTIITLNALLLFLVLFFVYPLKFLFVVLTQQVANGPVDGILTSQSQVASLMILYGLGFAAIHAIFTLFHLHAWRQRDELKLDANESLLTIEALVTAAAVASLGLLCALIAWILRGFPSGNAGYAGFIFFFIAPVYYITSAIIGRKRKALLAHHSKKP
jgi:uncharacterized membrane protein